MPVKFYVADLHKLAAELSEETGMDYCIKINKGHRVGFRVHADTFELRVKKRTLTFLVKHEPTVRSMFDWMTAFKEGVLVGKKISSKHNYLAVFHAGIEEGKRQCMIEPETR